MIARLFAALDMLTLARTVRRLARQVDALTQLAAEATDRADVAEAAYAELSERWAAAVRDREAMRVAYEQEEARAARLEHEVGAARGRDIVKEGVQS